MPPMAKKDIDSKLMRFIASGEAERLGAQEILTWAIKNFHPKIALSCSFGAPEGLVLLDMMHRIEPTRAGRSCSTPGACRRRPTT